MCVGYEVVCVCVCVRMSVCSGSLSSTNWPPCAVRAGWKRVQGLFGTRGGNGLLGRGEKLRPVYPPPPIPGPGSCTWSISKLEIAVVCCVCGGGGGEVTIARGHLSSRVLLPLIPGCQKETRTENKVVIAYIPQICLS